MLSQLAWRTGYGGYLMGKSQVFFMSSAYLKGKDFGSVLQRLNEILIKALDLPNCQYHRGKVHIQQWTKTVQ